MGKYDQHRFLQIGRDWGLFFNTKRRFKLFDPLVRQPRGDTRVTPEDKQRLAEQRAAEIAKRRADFNATNN